MNWWVANLLQSNPPLLFAQVFWVIGSIVLHELAHGWAALWQGDDTPRITGHMTWNPLVHMGGMSLIMFALIGIAWGAMPVNPARFRSKYGDALVSLAGPAMNGALAAIAIVAAGIWRRYAGATPPNIADAVAIIFFAGAWLNILLMIFNLLPIPPLDGSRILAGLLPPYRALINNPNAAGIAMIAFILLWAQIGNALANPIAAFVVAGRDAIAAALP